MAVGSVFRFGGRLVRAVLAAAVLAALISGVPWSLAHFVGWPLPHHVPAGYEVRSVLTEPMSSSLLVNTLSCILWPTWAMFTLDVVRATAGHIRITAHPKLEVRTGPIQAVATALVGAILLSVLSSRSPSLAASRIDGASSTSRALTPAGNRPDLAPTPRPQPTTARAARTVEVQPPRNGVHDSLWRIADRTLGDGARWPEIYQLNRGLPQPDGRTLSSPSLIRPGWILHLPTPPPSTTAHHPHPKLAPHKPHPETSPPRTSTPATTPPTTTEPSSPTTPPPASTSPAPARTAPVRTTPARTVPTPHSSPGVDLPSGAFVSAGLAAIVAAALLTLRRRRRVRYRPGSGDRTDLTIAPVVRALRIAHDLAEPAPSTGEAEHSPGLGTAAPGVRTSTVEIPTPGADLGVKDGRLLAVDLARTRGLGLIGPGAHDAARALLVSLIAGPRGGADRQVDVLMPSADAHALLGADPPGVRVVDTLDAALDAMETELLSRARTTPDDVPTGNAELALLATPDVQHEHRLQAVLDNGSSLGLTAVLLGQWRPGGTARIRADGTVAATSPSVTALAGTRMFTLPATDTADLLHLLHHARPGPPAPALALVRTAPAPLTHPPAPGPPSRTSRHQPVARGGLGPGQAKTSETDAPQQLNTPQPAAVATSDPPPATEDSAEEPDPKPPAPPEPPHAVRAHVARAWNLTVLGRIRLTHHQRDGAEHADASPALAPKHREVLTYLALHPHGARREALADAIWPNAPTSRPYNSFHATLSQLRRALRAAAHDEHLDITTHTDDGRYTLDQEAIDVDLWQLQAALDEARHADNLGEQAPLDHVITLYQGDLAADITAEWLESPREALRRDVLDLISSRARALRDHHPEQALTLLERARTLDSYNEAVYRAIARIQARLGQWEAIPRTRALLTATLADIDEQPSPETTAFFDALQQPRPAPGRRADAPRTS